MAGIGVKYDKAMRKYREWDGKKWGMVLDAKINDILMSQPDPDRGPGAIGRTPGDPPPAPVSAASPPKITFGTKNANGSHPLSGMSKVQKKPLSIGPGIKPTKPLATVVVYMGRQYAFDGTVGKGGKWKSLNSNGTLGKAVSDAIGFKLTELYFPSFLPKIPLKGGRGDTLLGGRISTNKFAQSLSKANMKDFANKITVSTNPKGNLDTAKQSKLIGSIGPGAGTPKQATVPHVTLSTAPKVYPPHTPSSNVQGLVNGMRHGLGLSSLVGNGSAPSGTTSPAGPTTPVGGGKGPPGGRKPTASPVPGGTSPKGGTNLMGDLVFNTAKTNMLLIEMLRRMGNPGPERDRATARRMERHGLFGHRPKYRRHRGHGSQTMATGLLSGGLGALLAWTLLPKDIKDKLISKFSKDFGDIVTSGVKAGLSGMNKFVADTFVNLWDQERKRARDFVPDAPIPKTVIPTRKGVPLTADELEKVTGKHVPTVDEKKKGLLSLKGTAFNNLYNKNYSRGEAETNAMDTGGIAGGLMGRGIDALTKPWFPSHGPDWERFMSLGGRDTGKLWGKYIAEPQRLSGANANRFQNSMSENYWDKNRFDYKIDPSKPVTQEEGPKFKTQEPFLGPATSSGEPEPSRPTTRPEAQMSPADIVSYLKSKGISENIAVALTKNMGGESSLDSNAENPDSKAFGLAQWLGSRKDDLNKFATNRGKKANDPKTQLDFMVNELGGKEGNAYSKLTAADQKGASIEDLVKIVALQYERFQGGLTDDDIVAKLKKRNDFSLAPIKKEMGIAMDEAFKRNDVEKQAAQRTSGQPVQINTTNNNVTQGGGQGMGPIAETSNPDLARTYANQIFNSGI